MLPQKNNVSPFRYRIITKVAESFVKERFKNADGIPAEIMPDGAMFYHGDIETDRDIIKKIAMAVMGFVPAEEEGHEKSLNEYGQEALKREKLLPSKLSVIGAACAACMKQQHVVTNFCRGCIARPCQMNCPKGAISFTEENKAHTRLRKKTKLISIRNCALTAAYALTAARTMPLSRFRFRAKILVLWGQSAKTKTAKNILMPKNAFPAENVCVHARLAPLSSHIR